MEDITAHFQLSLSQEMLLRYFHGFRPGILLQSAVAPENLIFWALLPIVISFSFIMFVIYRMRREAQIRQKEAEYKQQAAEIEMKALRAQMNPHFIFNALNSIYVFIQEKKDAQASEYLLKFSKLIRLVLENSMHREVSMSDDLEALELYMQLEKLRIAKGFDYNIDIQEGLNIQEIYIPPLILQPFVENSIWHGLNKKPEKGMISIHVKKKENHLHIVVEDNGIESIVEMKEDPARAKKKSLGMDLTRDRLNLLNTGEVNKAELIVTDLRSATGEYQGKHVELILPLESD